MIGLSKCRAATVARSSDRAPFSTAGVAFETAVPHAFSKIALLSDLNNTAPGLVDFDFLLAQRVMPNISDVRAAKSAFQLSTDLQFVKEGAEGTVCEGTKGGATPRDAVGVGNQAAAPGAVPVAGPLEALGHSLEFLGHVISECGRIVPLSLEAEKSWLAMVAVAYYFSGRLTICSPIYHWQFYLSRRLPNFVVSLEAFKTIVHGRHFDL
ncbi:uncharacterized protein BXZ73DRAFT_100904 [Epithele typhae]|uniref:uncharacterized protein n=1 Tax=Epithele typhae TaxID=378194 RepID=UPI002008179A|nr:uncharacterized protein BXZ73DRAFT_100904 [Epithele typhae]KAH9934063.1 hypothetical protein BXZ73DRAFT_100904 [Epithele typhae]